MIVLMKCCCNVYVVCRYFFGVLSALMVIGTLNGLVLLPVLLSICGPPAEVIHNVLPVTGLDLEWDTPAKRSTNICTYFHDD